MRDGRRKRRWFRFSLGALLVLVALAAWGIHFANTRRLVRLRQHVHENHPVRVTYLNNDHEASPPWLWRLLGAEPLSNIGLAPQATDEDVAAVQALFPEAHVTVLVDDRK
ncbi:MAG: hypothetical protein DWQ37_19315 [Planctomycetota bacterium]|nr:MAG: hypothetical protein DWQ37_19315 [Planctomycetota bacterium]